MEAKYKVAIIHPSTSPDFNYYLHDQRVVGYLRGGDKEVDVEVAIRDARRVFAEIPNDYDYREVIESERANKPSRFDQYSAEYERWQREIDYFVGNQDNAKSFSKVEADLIVREMRDAGIECEVVDFETVGGAVPYEHGQWLAAKI